MATRTRLALLVLAVVAIGVWQHRLRAPHRDEAPPVAPPVAAAPATTPAPPPPPAPIARGPAPSPEPAPGPSAAAETYDLAADEARGGHTLARHVGRTDTQLLDRLARERNISAASTYTDRSVAERTVARTLSRSRSRVDAWLARSGNRPNLALDYRGNTGEVIGRSIRRGSQAPVTCSNAIIVLRWDGRRGFFVLTSYPEAAR